jgi:hypothetical protein
MSDAIGPEVLIQSNEAGDARKPWTTPLVIVADGRNTEAHVTRFTDGTDTGGNHSQYGS